MTKYKFNWPLIRGIKNFFVELHEVLRNSYWDYMVTMTVLAGIGFIIAVIVGCIVDPNQAKDASMAIFVWSNHPLTDTIIAMATSIPLVIGLLYGFFSHIVDIGKVCISILIGIPNVLISFAKWVIPNIEVIHITADKHKIAELEKELL